MNLTTLDEHMRQLEKNYERVLPQTHFIVRLDGRSFTSLTKKGCSFDAPFDTFFHHSMLTTMKQLMHSGIRVVVGYTQSDEISLLLSAEDNAFGRRFEKILTILAATASAHFSLAIGTMATFDARLVPIPSKEDLEGYFLWRIADSERNSLNGYCYWEKRKEGLKPEAVASFLKTKTTEEKLHYLGSVGIDWLRIPSWQKFGTLAYFKDRIRIGKDRLSGEKTEKHLLSFTLEEDFSSSRDIHSAIIQAVDSLSQGE